MNSPHHDVRVDGATTALTHHTARVKDIRLHYTEAGQGPAIVLLHGWPHTAYGWREVQTRLATTHRVIAVDIRGAGYSTKAETGYDADNLADDIHELIRGVLGLDKVVIVGHDWGAVWAYHYAALFRDEVAGLGCFEMMIPGTGGHEAGMVPKPDGQFFWHMGWHSVPQIPGDLLQGKERMYLSYYYENFAYNPTAVDRDAIDEYVHCMTLMGALRSGLKIYPEFWRHAEQAQQHLAAGKLDIPVIAYGGDALMGDACLHSMTQLAHNVTGGAIPQCGHWVAEERPDFVAEAIAKLAADAGHVN